VRTTTTIQPRMGRSVGSLLLRLAAGLAIVLFFALLSRAGGPEFVAGSTYFDSTVTSQALVWPLGQVNYYTDQGDLSPILPNASANALVADAFSQWTAVPTAALTITAAGQLAEDVNGANVARANGVLNIPTDIQPLATSTPVGVVYDIDGSVTSALLGSGAGDPSQCFANAVFGGVDNYNQLAAFQHALVAINGQCAQQSSQLTDVEYRLVRVLGSVLGVGWSQLNLNVITGNPRPTSDDFAGFPVMHDTDPTNCVPITRCYPNPYQLTMDDAAEISRLYPITTDNQSTFPGKQVFATSTARIHGSVWFTDSSGNPTQPMQGVNVVARWIDPTTGQPSRKYAATSISGLLFVGNAGNPITGYTDPLGRLFSQWGSADQSLEGFFDLAGLQLPNGASTGQYQLSVEALDPDWSSEAGPYGPLQVAPSGTPQPIIVTVAPGTDLQQDILMSASVQPVPQWATSESWTAPAAIPAGGDWVGSLNGYGDNPFFSLTAQANRTLSIAVTAFDETGNASTSEAQPVIGMWAAIDQQGTPPPAFTPSSFNSTYFGITRLDAQILTANSFRIGVLDYRGDGRPDYHYHAHVLYADSVIPSRVSVRGGALTLQGIGFMPGLAVSLGAASATPLSMSAGQIILAAPAQAEGLQNLTITEPATGSFSTMTGALTFGAAADDKIVLLEGTNPQTPVGTQTQHPIVVQVFAADGVTPVDGATVGWSTTNSAALSTCNGAFSCSAITDESGFASTWVTPGVTGAATITATLAPGVYKTSQSVATTVSATSSSSDLAVLTPFLWIAQGATVSIPVTARVVNKGVAQNGITVNFSVLLGSGSLSAASAQTDNSGDATVTLNLTNFAASVQVSACVAPANAPCQSLNGTPVSAAAQNLQPVSGEGQVTTLGQSFQPFVVRAIDNSSPPNAVVGASVTFQTTVMRPTGDSPTGGTGESGSGNPELPLILSVSQSTIMTDINGLASIAPSTGPFSGPLDIDVAVAAGLNATLESVLEAWPSPQVGIAPIGKDPPTSGRIPAPVERPARSGVAPE
jgi:hypothetical protein